MEPVARYPDALLDKLRSVVAPQNVDAAVVVVLTPGVANFACFDHAILERADNTARILDVTYDLLAPEPRPGNGYNEWGALLRSVITINYLRNAPPPHQGHSAPRQHSCRSRRAGVLSAT